MRNLVIRSITLIYRICSYLLQFIAVAKKLPHDRRSEEEKASLKESRKDQDTSGKLEVKTKGDEEGTAVIALLLIRL